MAKDTVCSKLQKPAEDRRHELAIQGSGTAWDNVSEYNIAIDEWIAYLDQVQEVEIKDKKSKEEIEEETKQSTEAKEAMLLSLSDRRVLELRKSKEKSKNKQKEESKDSALIESTTPSTNEFTNETSTEATRNTTIMTSSPEPDSSALDSNDIVTTGIEKCHMGAN